MKSTDFLLGLGRAYERIYRIPLAGEFLVRGFVRFIAWLAHLSPSLGIKKYNSIGEIERQLLEMCGQMGFEVEVVRREPDRFEFIVHSCPYGYHRPEQEGVCEAAMDMDRLMFRYCGANLSINESTVKGAPACRLTMTKI